MKRLLLTTILTLCSFIFYGQTIVRTYNTVMRIELNTRKYIKVTGFTTFRFTDSTVQIETEDDIVNEKVRKKDSRYFEEEKFWVTIYDVENMQISIHRETVSVIYYEDDKYVFSFQNE